MFQESEEFSKRNCAIKDDGEEFIIIENDFRY